MQRIRASSQRMTALIDALLAFARLGRQQLTRQQVQPTDIARRALGDLDDDIAGRAVQATVAADLPPCAADPALLAVVYTNLLSNAIKYSRGRDPAVIDVGWQLQDDHVVYHVTDNGAGFNQQYADKLFGVFQRLHSPQEFEGIGIGLALVQRIIHRHGGKIWAAGELDHGATFSFTLPGGTPP